MSQFTICTYADGGEFIEGDTAAIAWDVLRLTGSHRDCEVYDLTRTPHLKPYAIACLAASAALQRQKQIIPTVVPPSNNACNEHLQRLGLYEFFEATENRQVWSRSSNLKVQKVTYPPGRVSENAAEVLTDGIQLTAGVRPQIVTSLDEVLLNALSHAESPIECVIVGQGFPQSGKVEVAVVDLGIGILNHLRRNAEYEQLSNDEEAIELATQDGVTGTRRGTRNRLNEQNSGAGLHYLRKYCEAGGGECTILSGRHWVTYHSGERVVGRLKQPFQGTLVNLRFFAAPGGEEGEKLCVEW